MRAGGQRLRLVYSSTFFVLAVLVFALVVWNQFFDSSPRGEWRTANKGASIAVNAIDAKGEIIDIVQPALLFFFEPECRFCQPAHKALVQYMKEARRTTTPSVYGLTSDSVIKLADGVSTGVPVLRVVGPNPSLTFIREVPTFVRTDSNGIVESVYVGVPSDAVLNRLLFSVLPARWGN